jgi:thiol-disulfide isomerase/thioredoxin
MFNSQFSIKKSVIVFFIVLVAITASAQEIPKWKIADLEDYIAKTDSPLVVSFWATYCVPCIKEIPVFEKVVKEYASKGVKMLLVSLDFEESYPKKIIEFVKKRKFRSPLAWLDETNADYFCPRIDSKWSGVMPATLFINNKTRYRHFLEEEIPEEKFKAEILKLIGGH